MPGTYDSISMNFNSKLSNQNTFGSYHSPYKNCFRKGSKSQMENYKDTDSLDKSYYSH